MLELLGELGHLGDAVSFDLGHDTLELPIGAVLDQDGENLPQTVANRIAMGQLQQ